METVYIKLEFAVDVNILKKVLKERGIIVNMSNINKIASVYKKRRYTMSDKKFFDDIPKDRDTLLMYGFTFERKEE